MRKSEREIADVQEKFAALLRCGYMTLAVEGEGAPYCVPLNFGAELAGDALVLYFHCAREGKKLDLIEKNSNVCVEVDSLAGYRSTGHGITADYKSAIAFGRAERVCGEELVRGLELLLKHCRIEGYSARECAARDITAVVKITVDDITGKRRFAE